MQTVNVITSDATCQTEGRRPPAKADANADEAKADSSTEESDYWDDDTFYTEDVIRERQPVEVILAPKELEGTPLSDSLVLLTRPADPWVSNDTLREEAVNAQFAEHEELDDESIFRVSIQSFNA